jgi:hypothetical protein
VDATDSQTDPQATAPPQQPGEENVLDAYSARDKVLLWLGAIACIAIVLGGAALLDVPAQSGKSASLLQQPNWIIAILGTAVMFVAAVIVGSLVTWRVHPDAGLMCATVGLAVLSVRGGPMRYALFESPQRSVFLSLASELFLLGALAVLGWMIVNRFFGAGEEVEIGCEQPSGQKLLTTATQAVGMTILMLLLCKSDDKAQCLAAVGISALLASMAAHWFAPAAPSPWVWTGPLLVGMIGYLIAYFRARGIEIGRIDGPFAALARPLPLDYASLGVAGAMMGYWTAARWHRAGESKEP